MNTEELFKERFSRYCLFIPKDIALEFIKQEIFKLTKKYAK